MKTPKRTSPQQYLERSVVQVVFSVRVFQGVRDVKTCSPAGPLLSRWWRRSDGFAFEAPIWKHLEKGWVTRPAHRMDSTPTHTHTLTHTQVCINNWCAHMSLCCILVTQFMINDLWLMNECVLFYNCWILPHSSRLQQPHTSQSCKSVLNKTFSLQHGW